MWDDMAYVIQLDGSVHATLRLRFAELVGDDAIREEDGATTVAVPDQPAMIAMLHRLNDLGLRVDRVERR